MSRLLTGSTMIKACIFDLGNVLVFFSHERMWQQIAELCGTTSDKIQQMLMTSGVQNELETGRMSDDEFRTLINRQFEVEVGIDDLKQAAADIFWLNEEIVPVLSSLKKQGMRLILLSNTSNAHFEFVKQEFDILEYFEDFTLSFEVGTMKPHAAIYEDAVRRAGVEPNECFFTDDIEENIAGARSVGLKAAVFKGAEELTTAMAQHGINV